MSATAVKTPSYKIYKRLGQGGYGEVFLGKDSSGRQVVVKKIYIDVKNKERALNEVRIMKKVWHNNVIHFIDSFVHNHSLIIVMEYAKGGDLGKFIKKRMGEMIQEDLVWNIFLQITFGVRYLHSLRILHRDLKTQNIFLMADGTVRIGDLGIGRILQGDDRNASTVIGTPYYFSPEICKGLPYDHKSDMWSLGCILYELCTLNRAFSGANVLDVVNKILHTSPAPILNPYTQLLKSLVDNLLSKSPDVRMSAEEICNNRYVSTIINDMFDIKGMTTVLFNETQLKVDETSKEEDDQASRQMDSTTQ